MNKLLAAIWFVVCSSCFALTRTADTLSYSDVNAAINGGTESLSGTVNALNDGDICILPAGTATWTQKLTISKNITLQGVPSGTLPATPATAITGSGSNGQLINWNTTSSLHTATLKWLNIVGVNSATNQDDVVSIGGIATVNVISGKYSGGFRITQVKWSSADNTTKKHNSDLAINDWVTGVVDHCWFHYATTFPPDFRLIDVSHSSAPGYITGDLFTTSDGDNIKAQFGQYSFSKYSPYTFGGGPNVNGVNDAVYIEDCIAEGTDSLISITDLGGIARGGGRVVVRHCSMWGHVGSHGYGESGDDAGCAFYESYNNFYSPNGRPPNLHQHDVRSGISLFFNERYQAIPGGNSITPVGIFRLANPAGSMIGPADGTNFFDLNARDSTFVSPVSGARFNALTPTSAETANSRIGYRYATGNLSKQVTAGRYPNTVRTVILIGLDPHSAANKYVGFTVRNETLSTAENAGGQEAGSRGNQYCTFITASTGVSNGTLVTVADGYGSGFKLGASDTWSLRWVKNVMGAPGGGTMATLNGGNVRKSSTVGMPYFAPSAGFGTGPNPNNPIWPSQAQAGLWEWDNMYRANSTATWVDAASLSSTLGPAIIAHILGGVHDGSPINKKSNGTSATYPTQPNTAANLKIGADWDSGTFGGIVSIGSIGPGAATQAYGYTYPYPLDIPTP